jgi:hypothetical protein
MKIKSKIYILFGVFLIAIVVAGFFLYGTSVEMNQAVGANKDSNEMMIGLFELNVLTNDYLLGGQERAIEQWQLRYDSLGELFSEERHEGHGHYEGEATSIGHLAEDYEEFGNLFSELIKIEGSLELEERLVSQLLIKSQEIVSHAFEFSYNANERVLHAQERDNLLNMIFFGLVFILISVGVYIIISATTKIDRISAIIDRISKGEINVEINGDLKSGDNEVSSLVMSLERILASLKLAILRMNVSKGDLGLKNGGGRVEEKIGKFFSGKKQVAVKKVVKPTASVEKVVKPAVAARDIPSKEGTPQQVPSVEGTNVPSSSGKKVVKPKKTYRERKALKAIDAINKRRKDGVLNGGNI